MIQGQLACRVMGCHSVKRHIKFFAFVWMLGIFSSFMWFQPSEAQTLSVGDPLGPETKTRALLEKAETALEVNQVDTAISIYLQILSRYSETPFRERIYKGLGESYLKGQDSSNAIVIFKKFLREFPNSPDRGLILNGLAESYLASNNLEGAILAFERRRGFLQDRLLKKEVTERLVAVLVENQRFTEAIENLLLVRVFYADNRKEKRELESRIIQLVLRCRTQELNELIERYPKDFPGDKALIQLAALEESQGLFFEAERELNRFMQVFPRHPDRMDARFRLRGIKKELLQNQFLVGVLLPMTGPHQVFSDEILKGVRFAISRFLPAPLLGRTEKFVNIVVKDSAGGHKNINRVMSELIHDYKVVAIIGPLLSSELGSVVKYARRFFMPVVTPSATTAVFPKGEGYLFRNAMTLQAQGYLMADYAVEELGLKRFCILYPEDVYGNTLMRLFSERITKLGGEIIDVEWYAPQTTDFSPQIKRLKTTDLSRYGILEPVNEDELGDAKYIPGFDAVYIPGDYDQVGLIAAGLAFYDIHNVILLGSNGWHSVDLLRIGGRNIEGGIFVDGFFPDSTEPAIREFVSGYRLKYREDPTLLAAQAYDSTMMILTALNQGARTKEQIRQYLQGVNGFQGVTGKITTKAGGEMERELYVIQVRGGKFVQVY